MIFDPEVGEIVICKARPDVPVKVVALEGARFDSRGRGFEVHVRGRDGWDRVVSVMECHYSRACEQPFFHFGDVALALLPRATKRVEVEITGRIEAPSLSLGKEVGLRAPRAASYRVRFTQPDWSRDDQMREAMVRELELIPTANGLAKREYIEQAHAAFERSRPLREAAEAQARAAYERAREQREAAEAQRVARLLQAPSRELPRAEYTERMQRRRR